MPGHKYQTAMSFRERCKDQGIGHELRWYWVKAFASERWRQLARGYRWIFILGCNNSGTTLLTRMLDSHPAIAAIPKGGRGSSVVLARPKLVNAVRLWTEKIDQFRLTEADQHLDALRLIYDWVSAVQFSPRPFLLEKAPPDMVCARWFQSVFPDALFIGLIRNGYAVAEGMSRREGYSLDRCARHWTTANQTMLDDAEHLKHFLLVRYEELVNEPLSTVKHVSEFLDIDSQPLEGAIDAKWQVHNMDNAAATIQDFNVKSLERLSKDDINVISHHAREMLDRLGYLVPDTLSS